MQLIIVQEGNKIISLPKFNSQHDSYLCNVNNVNKNHVNDIKSTRGYVNPIYFNHKDNIEMLKVSNDYENQNYFAETNFTHLIKNCKISLNENLKFTNDYKIQIFLNTNDTIKAANNNFFFLNNYFSISKLNYQYNVRIMHKMFIFIIINNYKNTQFIEDLKYKTSNNDVRCFPFDPGIKNQYLTFKVNNYIFRRFRISVNQRNLYCYKYITVHMLLNLGIILVKYLLLYIFFTIVYYLYEYYLLDHILYLKKNIKKKRKI